MRSDVVDARLDRLPASVLPLLYVATAHFSLALALFCVGWWPRAVVGFFYHSWMVGLVHLVTLGWITMSILGLIYVVGPFALRMPFPVRRRDYVAFAFTTIGLVGMVGHFWIQEFGGMAWSAGTASCGIFYVVLRLTQSLRRSTLAGEAKLYIDLAAFNVCGAATAGVLLACDKVYHFLPGFVLTNVFAHAHLAAVGWATMMVMGIGYRLLPMLLPSKPPKGAFVMAGAVFMELGVIALFVGLFTRAAWTLAAALSILIGISIFLWQVMWMLRHRRRSPVARHSPDFGVYLAGAAACYLVLAAALGVFLLEAEPSERTLHVAVVYGIAGILGFLSQMILGLEFRLLPVYAWYWAFGASQFESVPESPLAMGSQDLRFWIFVCWVWGMPVLVTGFFLELPLMVGVGAWTLLAGLMLASVNTYRTITSARRSPPHPSHPPRTS